MAADLVSRVTIIAGIRCLCVTVAHKTAHTMRVFYVKVMYLIHVHDTTATIHMTAYV